METIAIIGTGIAGMSAAHLLKDRFRLSIFEQNDYVGGHTRTETVPIGDNPVSVDTGFMVYNEETYPKLTALFKKLQVTTVPTEMSFGVQHRPTRLEYCGSNLNQLFAQRSNLFSIPFWRMIRDILKFNKIATEAVTANEQDRATTLAQFIQTHKFSELFKKAYILPMTSAIWSTPPDQMLAFPAHTLFRFMYNHGLLGVQTHHQWRTVLGGSKTYRDKIIAPFKDQIRTNCRITSVRRIPDAVELTDEQGNTYRYKRVIIATHADQALRLLDSPSELEIETLSAFSYTANKISLHTDTGVMPKSKGAWASWNYRTDEIDGHYESATHYWMNSLQPITEKKPIIVSVNGESYIDPKKIIKQFTFDHPVFTEKTLLAQEILPSLNKNGKVYFAGSYFRYGFHEDALMAGTEAAQQVIRDYQQKDAKLAI